MPEQTRKLDSRLEAAKFKMVGYQPGEFYFKGRAYDTRKMSVAEARKVIELGAKFIKATTK